MLEQVLQQNASKAEAKSKQSQRQTLVRHLLVFERGFSPSHPFVQLGDERSRRFWSKVEFAPGDLCWKWMGEINHRGYGRFTFKGLRTVAHRVAYELAVGPIPDDLQCGHLCDNPPCVRPSHLRPMTAKENIAQRDERMGRTPGKPLSQRERNRRHWARLKERRAQERLESGWWVSI